MGKVIADLAASAASATLSVENATSSVNYVLSKTDGSANDHLKTDGSGNLAWVAPPAGGLTDASQWRLAATITGDHIPITGTWEESDTYGYGRLGSAMVEVSGVFTFPSTGYWLVMFCGSMDGEPGGASQHQYRIDTTIDNATYNAVSSAFAEAQSTHRQSGTAFHLFDVTSTTNCKVRFSVDITSGGTSNETLGSTTENLTYATFVKLADT